MSGDENIKRRLFEQLALRQKAVIESVCRRFFVGDRYLQQNAAQEILGQLWHGMDALAQRALPPDEEKAWVYRCAVNTVTNLYRQQLRQRRRLVPLDVDRHDRSDDDTAQQMQERLYDLIDALPDEDKELMLYYLDSRTEAEIAALMHISPGNVAIRIYRIKNKLLTLRQQQDAAQKR